MKKLLRLLELKWLAGGAIGLLLLLLLTLVGSGTTLASHGSPHLGELKTWSLNPVLPGQQPVETVDDVTALTNHVGKPSMVTAMAHFGGLNGFLFWNPKTNAFKGYRVVGSGPGLQFAVDINRSAPATATPPSFGGGYTWGTIFGDTAYSPYMNFRGSINFRR